MHENRKNRQVYNPFLPLNEFIPDGEPHVFGDRVYLFGSHDMEGGSDFCMQPYVIYSAPADDLTDWSAKGISYDPVQDPHVNETRRYIYAPDCVQGNDGKFYLYYCLEGYGGPICVAVCDTPDGRYAYLGEVRNPDGSAYRRFIPFDPAVINDDGVIRLYYGVLYPFEDQRTPENSDSYDQIQQQMFMKTKEELEAEPDGVMGAVTVVLSDDMLTVKSEPCRICPVRSTGTSWEAHPFFEGSSIRKAGDTYYFIYASWHNHELCYATSDRPDGGFTARGTIISGGDIGLLGRKPEDTLAPMGNIHGSIVCIRGKWYVFYHRQTHNTNYSRQACAEPVSFRKDGTIEQAEVTSCGLNGKPLPGTGRYPAVICCNLTNGHMPQGGVSNIKDNTDAPCVSSDERERFVHHIESGTWICYKYFAMKGKCRIRLICRGNASGQLCVAAAYQGKILGQTQISAHRDWTQVVLEAAFTAGTTAICFCFNGTGEMDLLSFELEGKDEYHTAD